MIKSPHNKFLALENGLLQNSFGEEVHLNFGTKVLFVIKKTKGFKVIRYYKINRNGEKQEISAHARCNAIDQQIGGPK